MQQRMEEGGERETARKTRDTVREKQTLPKKRETYMAATWRQARWPLAPQKALQSRTAQEQHKIAQAHSVRVRYGFSDHILRHLPRVIVCVYGNRCIHE